MTLRLAVVPKEPNANVLDLLERTLALAKTGDVQSVALVYVTHDEVSCGYAGDSIALNYGLDQLKAALLHGEE